MNKRNLARLIYTEENGLTVEFNNKKAANLEVLSGIEHLRFFGDPIDKIIGNAPKSANAYIEREGGTVSPSNGIMFEAIDRIMSIIYVKMDESILEGAPDIKIYYPEKGQIEMDYTYDSSDAD